MERIKSEYKRSRRSVLKHSAVVGIAATGGMPTLAVGQENEVSQTTEDLSIDFSIPEEPVVDQETTASITVTIPELDLIDDPEEELTVRMLIDGSEVDETTTTVQTGEAADLSLTHVFGSTGDTTVTIVASVEFSSISLSDSISQTVTVVDPVITVSGASFTLPDALQDNIDDYRSELDSPLPEYAFLLANSDTAYIVFSDSNPVTGRGSVDGVRLGDSIAFGGRDLGLLEASSVTFDQTGTEATIDAILTDTDSYAFEVVDVSGWHGKVGLRTRPNESGISFPTMTGVLSKYEQQPGPMFEQAGDRVRSALDDPQDGTIDELLGETSDSLATVSNANGFWSVSDPTLTGVVIPADAAARDIVEAIDQEEVIQAAGDGPVLNTIATDWQPTNVADIPTVQDQASSLEGEIIKVNAKVIQQTISVQEVMEQSTGCSTDLVQIKEACVDVVNDAVLHGGGGYTGQPETTSDVIPLIGVSTWDQRVPRITRTAEYDIIGEVVATEQIDPSLPEATAMLVYNLQKTGDLAYDTIADDTKTLVEGFTQDYIDELDQQATVDGDSFEPPVSIGDYADGETGTVDTGGLRDAIGDWRSGNIGTDTLRDVITAWRTGEVVA